MKDFKGKKDTELTKMLADKRKELRELHFDVSGSSARDTKHERNIKRDIARILTEINTR